MVLGLVETLLGEVELGLFGGQLRQLFPLLLAGTFFGQTVAALQVSQLNSQVKLVFGI